MRQRAMTGTSDLVRLVGAKGEDDLGELARAFGYARSRPIPAALPLPPLHEGAPEKKSDWIQSSPLPLAKATFWLATKFTAIPDQDRGKPERRHSGSDAVSYPVWRQRPEAPPSLQPLASWRELEVPLRHAFGMIESGKEIDVERVVERMGKGETLHRLPRLPLLRWGSRVQVLYDRSRRLTPYFDDQHYIAAHIRHLFAASEFWPAVMREGAQEPVSFMPDGEEVPYRRPPPGTPVLVLGDLGCLTESGVDRRFWLEFGRQLRASGCRPVALFPASARRCPAELSAVWTLTPWERTRLSLPMEGDEAPVVQLMRLLAPASRIETGLLRAVRRLLPEGACDAGVEAEFWQHPWLESSSPAGASMRVEQQAALREEFTRIVPPELRRAVAQTLRHWRADLPEEIWFRELLSLDPQSQTEVPDVDLEDARQYERAFCAELMGAGDSPQRVQDLAWQDWSAAVSTGYFWNDREVGDLLVQLHHRLNRDRPDYRLPPGVTPERILPDPEATFRYVALAQAGDKLILETPREDSGSFLARLGTTNGLVSVVEIQEVEMNSNPFWVSGTPPSWADAWGWDEYGAWVEFVVAGVRQRLRWIPPGRFRMGSPEGEPGRQIDEGPQHGVTITQGYWMFDTPCTQALWQAVMGENPSRFKSPLRPVERVSFEDVQAFLEGIEKHLPGLGLTLPSEAQWEYACRAGTTTALYTGEIKILGELNAPALDAIAWYGGNSGRDFDLEQGGDSKGWKEKQFEYKRGGTRLVGQKASNPWGLLDMLGNVLEWCVDAWHGSYAGAPTDGRPWLVDQASAYRVVRGGSWASRASNVRSAFRYLFESPEKADNLGFRCIRVQGSPTGQAGQGAQSEDPRHRAIPAGQASQGAEPGEARGAIGAAVLLDLKAGAEKSACPLPQGSHFHVQSDSETLTFGRITRPRWADAMGRDRFGLWAAFVLEPNKAPPVTQKMRWIPPGRFLMGSPEDEPGRIEDEGPQHEVMIQEGYWMFDTPCTQALWQAVMGENPSRFKSPLRPVEQVRFKDVQAFLEGIEKHAPGLGLMLPSEAQWEYACRAGTTTALYTGEMEILGERNAPALDAIAWYGGNSGEGFDLEQGRDSKGWKEKQYDHERAGTRLVGQKAPNPWGLYDMLGNVWEWCTDEWHDSYAGAPTDERPWMGDQAPARRVVRGGFWGSSARFVRSAIRTRYGLSNRFSFLGFRCIRVQE